MSSIFTKIIQGEIPGYKIAETDDFLAMLDINPNAEGHTLVIPKKEVDYIFDMEPETLGGMHQFAQTIAKALDKAIECKRVGVIVIGTEVPHAHIHLIPFTSEKQMSFSNPKMKFTSEEFQATVKKIQACL